MGNLISNKSKPSLVDAYNPSLNNWNVVERGTDFNVWRNSITEEEIQEYRFMVNDVDEFNKEKQAFEARHNNNNLIASKFFVDDTEKQFCANYYKGNLFIERIPLKVCELEKIQLPDILHIYAQCLKGFAELYDVAGFFSVNEDMIGINTEGVVKVWLNKNYGKSTPEPVYVQGTQRQMLIKLLKTLSNYCQGTVSFNLTDILLKSNPMTFKDSFMSLETLASKYNVDIPDYIQFAFRGTRRNNKTFNQSTVSSHINSTPSLNSFHRHSEVKQVHYRESMIRPQLSKVSEKKTYEQKKNQIIEKYNKQPDSLQNRRSILKQSSNSLVSSFPDFSRISRISLVKQRNSEFNTNIAYTSPNQHDYKKCIQMSLQHPQTTTPNLSTPKTPKFQRNTDLYYSLAKRSIPPESIKHLPIIRQNNLLQNSFSNPQNSLNYHVSDRKKLTQKYVNKIKKSDQTSVLSHYNQEPISYRQSIVNTQYDSQPKLSFNKPIINGDSSLSKFSINKKSDYQPSVSGKSITNHQYTVNQPSQKHSFNGHYHESVKNSQLSFNAPVISMSQTGVVYKQRQTDQPTFLSEASGINHSLSVIQQKPQTKQKMSMMRPQRSIYVNSNQQSYYSTEMDPELLKDLNNFKRKKFAFQTPA